MKSLKLGNVVLCEYVARGENHKQTLVNTFSGDVVVAEMPAQLKFGLYIETFPDRDGEFSVDVDIKHNRKVLAKISGLFPDATAGKGAVLAIPNFNLGTNEDFTLRVVLSAEGYRRTTALTKQVYKGEISFPSA